MPKDVNALPRIQAWQIADLSLRDLMNLDASFRESDFDTFVRIGILGDCATQHYRKGLAAALKARGVWPHAYEAEFNSIQQELLDPKSRLYLHQPEVVIFFNCVQALQDRFGGLEDESFVDITVEEIVGNWKKVSATMNVTVLQHNFCLPLDFTFGSYSGTSPVAFRNAVIRINAELSRKAAEVNNVRIIDTEFQAAYFGRRAWLDERFWCQAKQAFSPTFLPPLVKMVSDVVLEGRGVGVKCVVLDLDNTLWGGILGDVGLNGIEVGEVSGVGIGFARFQRALRLLSERGILLAVCSKNDQATAEEVFREHPDMELSLDDIACFRANYEDKATNILAIQKSLNIGLDSFVLLDDSRFERDYIRNCLPEIQVPELPEDPAEWLQALIRWNLFESSKFSKEDARRTQSYKSEAGRRELQSKSPDLPSYLKSLEMVAIVSPFNEFSLPRVSQLVQRSNQFNLTTRRHSDAQLKQFAQAADRYVTLSIRLKDRLGDNGIVAIAIGTLDQGDMIIDTWIMSCRVLGRRVEELTFSQIIRKALACGCQRIVGHYIESTKNAMVSELYARLGFEFLGSEGKTKSYAYDIRKFTPYEDIPIEIVEEGEHAN